MAYTEVAADTARDLDVQIDAKRNDVRTDKFDVTYGEFASMYEARELVIAPVYQRLFRWLPNQKTRFIESILLGIPTPAIFVAEDDENIWELVDGLQRLSTVLEFLGVLRDAEDEAIAASRLEGYEGASLPGLDGQRYDDLSLRSRMSIRRAGCRVEVLRVGSARTMKYDLFERLNTGGTPLSHQEVRNCVFRDGAADAMEYLGRLADDDVFQQHLGLSEMQAKSQYHRGLVLRYLALKNDREQFRHGVEPFMTAYLRRVVDGHIELKEDAEADLFKRTINVIAGALEDGAWRNWRDGKAQGAFSVYVFEALTVTVALNIEIVERMDVDERVTRFNAVKQDRAFQEAAGAGGNTPRKLEERLQAARRAIVGEDSVDDPDA